MSDEMTKFFAVSVNASTEEEIHEKIRNSNKLNKYIEQLPDWRNRIASIIKFLVENPVEQIYDPADDEISGSFQLERFLFGEFGDEDEEYS